MEILKTDELIVVKQLPVIEEQLKSIKDEIEERIDEALSMECNGETIGRVKELRAALNKDFQELEKRRKLVKENVTAPYNAFEKKYKECVTEILKSADAELKARIDEVEEKKRQEKRAEMESYFYELCASKNIDFLKFADACVIVTLSASKRSLREQIDAYVDKVCEELALIDIQEHKKEILYEYKKSKNLSFAITTVVARHKALDVPDKEADREVEKVAEVFSAPIAEKIKTMKIAVRGTERQLRALKEFLELSGLEYE